MGVVGSSNDARVSRRGGLDPLGSSDARLLLSFDTIDCNAAVAGGDARSKPGGWRGGSEAM